MSNCSKDSFSKAHSYTGAAAGVGLSGTMRDSKHPKNKIETVDVIVQYMIWIEPKEDCVKAELFMEQEVAWFNKEKIIRETTTTQKGKSQARSNSIVAGMMPT